MRCSISDPDCERNKGYGECLYDCDELFNTWYSIEDRSPEYGDVYVVKLNNGQFHTMTWCARYFVSGTDIITNVTHWMKPKVEEE